MYVENRSLTRTPDREVVADQAARRQQKAAARRARLGADGIVATAWRTAPPRRAL